MPAPTELTRRSNRVTLSAWGGSTVDYVDLLRAESACDARGYTGAWRVIELFGTGPFEVEISWTAGAGGGQTVFVTVPRSTRVCVYARDLVIRVANLLASEQTVSVMVSDGYADTENYFEQRGTGGVALATTAFSVPPFARRALLEVQDPALLATHFIAAADGAGVIRAKWPGNSQPGAGMPLGAASEVQVTAPGGAGPYRVVYTLNL